jgi:hypothetical protein
LGIPPAEQARLAEALAVLDWEAFTARVNAHPALCLARGAQQLHFVHARSNTNDAYDPRAKRAPRGAAQLLDEIRPAA